MFEIYEPFTKKKMKKCIKCNIEKELTDFYRQSKPKYYQPYSKECQYIFYSKKQDRRTNVKKWREKQHNGTFKVPSNHDPASSLQDA